MKFKFNGLLVLAAIALSPTFALSQEDNGENCQYGLVFEKIDGNTIKTSDNAFSFIVSENDANTASVWNKGDYLRVCNEYKLTNVSFRSLPTLIILEPKK